MIQRAPSEQHRAVELWKESRGLPASTVAEIEAYVVPASGVGWIDFAFRHQGSLGQRSRCPERKRLLCDWAGQSQAAATRQIVALADEWFAYCEEEARKEAAVVALAQEDD